MLRTLLCACLLASPGASLAQDWATAEVCTVAEARIDDAVLEPPGQDALEAAAAGIENARGRFWEITSPDGATSYLWGTYHSSNPLVLDLPSSVKEAISGSRIVAVEVDWVLKSREAYREAKFYEGIFRPPSDPFNFLPPEGTIAGLSAEVSNWIIDRAIELGWTEDVNMILSPAGLVDMLLSDPCEDFSYGVLPIQDDYIQLLGRLAGAEIVGLERPFQIVDDLNAAQPIAEAIIAVYGAYLKPETDNSLRATNIALYLKGRLGLMSAWDEAFLKDVLGERAEMALQLTDGYLVNLRNERFLQRIGMELEVGDIFIAVGAAHLPGEAGLVSLLRQEGYQATRIPVSGEAE